MVTTYEQIKDVYVHNLSADASGSTHNMSLEYYMDPTNGQICLLTINGVDSFEIYAATPPATPKRKIRWLKDGVMTEFGTLSDNACTTIFSGYGLIENKDDPNFQNNTLSTIYIPDGDYHIKLEDDSEYKISSVAPVVTHVDMAIKAFIDDLAKVIQKESQDLLDPFFARDLKILINVDGTANIEYFYVDMDGNAILDVDGHEIKASLVLNALDTPVPSVDFPGVEFTKELTIIMPEMGEDGTPVVGGTPTTYIRLVDEPFVISIAGNLSMCLYPTDGNPVEVNGSPAGVGPRVILLTPEPFTPVPTLKRR